MCDYGLWCVRFDIGASVNVVFGLYNFKFLWGQYILGQSHAFVGSGRLLFGIGFIHIYFIGVNHSLFNSDSSRSDSNSILLQMLKHSKKYNL